MKKYTSEYFQQIRYSYRLKERLVLFLRTWRHPRILFDYIEVLPAGAKVLDVGCGHGEFASRVADIRPDIILFGVDVSEVDVLPPLKKVVASGDLLPFKSNTFDLVVSKHVIEHVSDGGLFVSELTRVLKEGSIVYLECPDVRGVSFFSRPNFYDDPTHVRPYTIMAFERLAGLNDLEVIRNSRLRNFKIVLLGWLYLPVAFLLKDKKFWPGLCGEVLGLWICMLARKKQTKYNESILRE